MPNYRLHVKRGDGKVIIDQGNQGCLNWTRSRSRYNTLVGDEVLAVVGYTSPMTSLASIKLRESGRDYVAGLMKMPWFDNMIINYRDLVMPTDIPLREWLWIYSAWRNAWTYEAHRNDILFNWQVLKLPSIEMGWIMGHYYIYDHVRKQFNKKYYSCGEHCLPEFAVPKRIQPKITKMLAVIKKDKPQNEDWANTLSVHKLISGATPRQQVPPQEIKYKPGDKPSDEMEEWFGC